MQADSRIREAMPSGADDGDPGSDIPADDDAMKKKHDQQLLDLGSRTGEENE